ncbi:MAG: class I SAM-dependent methyltransferase [Actinomycetota bacterium]
MGGLEEGADLDSDVLGHYIEGAYERERLSGGMGRIEFARTIEILRRYIPPAPAKVLDVGGGAGVYASWLAQRGYDVDLVDPVPLHVEQAREVAAAQTDHPFNARLGDARRLEAADGSFDVVLLLGPLYHLTEASHRACALSEAIRVLRTDGVLAAAGISRFVSTIDGMRQHFLRDPHFRRIVERDLADGQHRNPTNHPGWFTTAYFHHPHELRDEMYAAGFESEGVFGIEGPAWILPPDELDRRWADPEAREELLQTARALEQEPTVIGIGAHLLAIGRRPN